MMARVVVGTGEVEDSDLVAWYQAWGRDKKVEGKRKGWQTRQSRFKFWFQGVGVIIIWRLRIVQHIHLWECGELDSAIGVNWGLPSHFGMIVHQQTCRCISVCIGECISVSACFCLYSFSDTCIYWKSVSCMYLFVSLYLYDRAACQGKWCSGQCAPPGTLKVLSSNLAFSTKYVTCLLQLNEAKPTYWYVFCMYWQIRIYYKILHLYVLAPKILYLPNQFILIRTDTYRYMWYRQIHTDLFNTGNIHTDINKCIQIHTLYFHPVCIQLTLSYIQYIQIHTDTCRYMQIHAIKTDTYDTEGYCADTYRYSQYRKIHTDTTCSLIKSCYCADTYWYSQYRQIHSDTLCLLIKSLYMLILSR